MGLARIILKTCMLGPLSVVCVFFFCPRAWECLHDGSQVTGCPLKVTRGTVLIIPWAVCSLSCIGIFCQRFFSVLPCHPPPPYQSPSGFAPPCNVFFPVVFFLRCPGLDETVAVGECDGSVPKHEVPQCHAGSDHLQLHARGACESSTSRHVSSREINIDSLVLSVSTTGCGNAIEARADIAEFVYLVFWLTLQR